MHSLIWPEGVTKVGCQIKNKKKVYKYISKMAVCSQLLSAHCSVGGLDVGVHAALVLQLLLIFGTDAFETALFLLLNRKSWCQPTNGWRHNGSVHLYTQSVGVSHLGFLMSFWGCTVVPIRTLWWYPDTLRCLCRRVYLSLKQSRINCGLPLVRNDEEWAEASSGRCRGSRKIGIDFSVLLMLSSDWPDFPLV